ncbi:hypothetical protein GOBAR_DD07262 [Gossypium barbadense]|nr:hypothetical protein GOBAR_DD07262 [Gossypium barbadense]
MLQESSTNRSKFQLGPKQDPEVGIFGFLPRVLKPSISAHGGKTAKQIAFEGIAIIQGRNKEYAISSAVHNFVVVKKRITTRIWNVNENTLTAEEIQKIEEMVVEALKLQAQMAREEPPFVVSTRNGKAIA